MRDGYKARLADLVDPTGEEGSAAPRKTSPEVKEREKLRFAGTDMSEVMDRRANVDTVSKQSSPETMA